MALVVQRALTVNEAGEPVKTFRGGDLITFRVDFTASDVPARTRVKATFHIDHLANFTMHNSALEYVFRPMHFWQFEYVIGGPGSWFMWSNWRLPDDEPLPGPMSARDWERVFLTDHWVFSSWRGPWELTAAVNFTEPPREGQFDTNRERWLYQIVY